MATFKKIFAGAAVFAALIFLFSLTVYADSLAVVTSDSARLMETAEADSRIVGTLSKNDNLKILGTDGEWFLAESPAGIVGYIVCGDADVLRADAAVSGTNVNVRKDASLSAQIIDNISGGSAVIAYSLSNDFYSVTYGAKTGYIHKDLLAGDFLDFLAGAVPPAARNDSLDVLCAIVNSNNGLHLRIGPGTNFDSITVLPFGAVADVVGIEGDWLKVSYGAHTGYMKSEFLTLAEKAAVPDNNKGVSLVEFAKQFLGTPYRWAGTDLRNGVDCSGFVYSVYKNFGITLNRTSRDMVNNGARVAKSELAPGDLVFFSNTGSSGISHVGLYIGGGSFIHAASSSSHPYVMISSLSEDYYARNYITGCRILK